MKVYVIEARKKSTRADYNSGQWRPVDADVRLTYARQTMRRWAEDHRRQEFRVRPYVPEVEP